MLWKKFNGQLKGAVLMGHDLFDNIYKDVIDVCLCLFSVAKYSFVSTWGTSLNHLKNRNKIMVNVKMKYINLMVNNVHWHSLWAA